MAGHRIIKTFETESSLIEGLGSLIQTQASEALKRNPIFTVGLSGGSLIKFLCQCLPKIETNWAQWCFFFCDERLVPFDDPDSTFGCYRKDLLAHVPVAETQFVKIDPSLNAHDAARDYEMKLKKYFPSSDLPQFDLLLLGMGPDGHTCSLFPGHPLLKENTLWIAPIIDSPKPPPCRVTMTLPVVNNAKCAIFAASGSGKADIVKSVLEGADSEPLPASLVRPRNGTVHWLLDNGAAGKLENKQSTYM